MGKQSRGLVACHAGCGRETSWFTTKRVYCEECRAEKKRESARRSMEKIRRSKGVEPVKGFEAGCSVCGKNFVRYCVHTHRCKSCQQQFTTQRTRDASEKKKTDDARRQRYNAWFKRHRIESPAYAVSAHLRTLMHRALGKQKAGRSWKSFVDYSLEDLMAHLERQFKPGMSWENRGEWHIDHIIPRASFEYSSPDDPEFKKCWALSNLQPLWAVDNIRKNARLDYLI